MFLFSSNFMLRRPDSAEGLARFREHGPSELSFGSGCSGSGQDREVADAISEVLQSLDVDTTFKHSFLTEVDSKKQKWLLETAKMNPHQPCLFSRMEELQNWTCNCLQCKKQCQVGRVDVFAAGTSCKLFSNFNKAYTPAEKREFLRKQCRLQAEGQQNSNHQSWLTFHAFILYLEEGKPLIFIWENVVLTEDKAVNEESNLEVVQKLMVGAGYGICCFILESDGFGLPADRKRLFILGV